MVAKTPPSASQRSERRGKEMVAFGEALGNAMRARGVHQVELADKLGVSQSMVSVWRSGQYACPYDVVFDIERILSLAPGTLSIRAGYLPPEAVQGGPTTVPDAVLADRLLNDADRHTILALYNHFVSGAPVRRPGRAKTGPAKKVSPAKRTANANHRRRSS